MDITHPGIDKTSLMPLYHQVKQVILNQISQGVLRPGDPLPTETALCELCSVSRPTVRQAINELVQEGHAYKVKNVGKFVAHPKMNSDLLDLYKVKDIEFSDLTPQNVTMRVLKMELRPATAKESRKLQIAEGTEIISLLRQRMMGSIVAFYIETVLIYPLCKSILDRSALEARSAYAILSDSPETKIGSISRDFEAVSSTTEEAMLLGITKGSPILLCTNICYSAQSGLPIIYDIVKYSGGKNKLSLRFNMT